MKYKFYSTPSENIRNDYLNNVYDNYIVDFQLHSLQMKINSHSLVGTKFTH